MSDKKEKDSKVKSSKAKKNVEKTQEVQRKRYFPTAVRTVVCLTVPSGTLLIRNFVLQKN